MKEKPTDNALEEITTALVNYSQLRFDRPPQVQGDGEMGAIAAGLMALGEELKQVLKSHDHMNVGGQDRKALLSEIGHQLRTPLTALQGYCDLLVSSGGAMPDRGLWLTRIQEAVCRLADLSRELEEAGIGDKKGRIQRRSFELGTRIDLECAQLRRFFIHNEITLEFTNHLNGPLLCEGDGGEFERLLTRSLSRFWVGTHRGTLKVRLSSEVLENKVWSNIEVIPEWEGSHAVDESSVWRVVPQSDYALMGETWRGVIEDIEALDGSLLALEGRNHDLRNGLRMRIPVEVCEERFSQATLGTREACVLIVDDTEMVRSVAGEMIELLGYRVELAASGSGALELLRKGHAFELVLMDFQMPGLTGAETVREMRMLEGLESHPPVVAMTAVGEGGTGALEGGSLFQGLLNKPFSLEQLETCLLKHLEAKER